ncbi:MAG: adenylate cyclase [Myxococcota bacterium]
MSLRTKFVLAFALVALVPLAALTYRVTDDGVERLEQSAHAYHVATADQALVAARGRVETAVAELKAVGLEFARDEPSRDVITALFLAAQAIEYIQVYEADGKFRWTAQAEGPPPMVYPESLPEPLRQLAMAGGRLVQGVIQRPGDSAPMVPLIIPIFRGEGEARELRVWMRTTLDLSPLSVAVGQLSRRRFGTSEDLVRLVDSKMRVIAAASPQARWKDLAGSGPLSGVDASGALFRKDITHTINYANAEGQELIGAVVPIPELGWAAIVEQDRDVAYASARETVRTALVVGGIFVLIAIALAFWMARRMSAPVLAVASSAKQVAAGDFAVRVDVPSGDEVGEMATAFNAMAQGLGEYRDKLVEEARVRGNLSRFLSPEVIDTFVVGKDKLELGGTRKPITVMFCDVVDFTKLVEEHPPEFVVGILNEFFTIVTEIVFKRGGIVDKFIGDCAMVMWGATETREDDSLRCVRAAEEILHWLEIGNAKWRKQLGRDLQVAIGIHTGDAVVGNVGSERRMEFTAIGEVVNLAARLERLARPNQILMTRDVMAKLGEEFELELLGSFDIFGRGAQPSEIFVLAED